MPYGGVRRLEALAAAKKEAERLAKEQGHELSVGGQGPIWKAVDISGAKHRAMCSYQRCDCEVEISIVLGEVTISGSALKAHCFASFRLKRAKAKRF